ncbi:MAG TPA: glycerol-3-phosphate 1-O-acyltransferase PlsY [Bryobacteraceae bacterium]|nr:glycerol-3-phosphate 1-O-acyltransferase PlsY [Bryobacteraceae bacterium]
MMGIGAVLLAYLAGGIPFGLIVVKLMRGEDIRQSGSGNIGATNVSRTAGPGAGILTLVLDAAKGWIAVWLAAMLTNNNTIAVSAAALAVLLGHAFSIWLRLMDGKFSGGKAVATFLGAFGYLAPVPLLAVAIVFAIVVASTRYVSLASICAAGLFPVACWMILHPEWPVLAAATAAAVLVIWRHSANIQRIRAGEERVFRFK